MTRTKHIFRPLCLLLSALLSLAVFAGCNQAASARDCVDKFRLAMNQNDYHTAFVYVSNYDGFGFNDANTERIIDAVSSSLQIDILSESGGSVTSALTVSITTIDLREIYCQAAQAVVPQFYSTAVSGNSLASAELSNKLVDEVIARAGMPDAVKATTECTLYVTNNNGKWTISLDSTAYSAITGYINDANDLVAGGQIMIGTDYGASNTAPATVTTAPSDDTVIEGLDDVNATE